MVTRLSWNFSIVGKSRWPRRTRIRWCRHVGIQVGWIWLILLRLALRYHRGAWMDMSQMGMWLPICRRNWRGERSPGCSQRGYRCRRSKWCRLWCCEWWRRHRDVRRHFKWWWRTGRHWTWVFGVGNLLWVRKFLVDWDEKWEMQLILSLRWRWTDSNLVAKLPSLICTNFIEKPGYLDKSPPRNSFDIFHSF